MKPTLTRISIVEDITHSLTLEYQLDSRMAELNVKNSIKNYSLDIGLSYSLLDENPSLYGALYWKPDSQFEIGLHYNDRRIDPLFSRENSLIIGLRASF
jgi:hypothetical protein